MTEIYSLPLPVALSFYDESVKIQNDEMYRAITVRTYTHLTEARRKEIIDALRGDEEGKKPDDNEAEKKWLSLKAIAN